MDIVTTLKHPKFGSVSDKHEQIEVSDERKCDLKNAFTFSLELLHGTATDKFFFSLQKSFVNLYQTLSEAAQVEVYALRIRPFTTVNVYDTTVFCRNTCDRITIVYLCDRILP